jgi:hypothetical protein
VNLGDVMELACALICLNSLNHVQGGGREPAEASRGGRGGRPIVAPLERPAELLAIDLATVRELAAKVEP